MRIIQIFRSNQSQHDCELFKPSVTIVFTTVCNDFFSCYKTVYIILKSLSVVPMDVSGDLITKNDVGQCTEMIFFPMFIISLC